MTDFIITDYITIINNRIIHDITIINKVTIINNITIVI
jgi:hypothetical protein